ncbi:SDR family NAD(P)-dependent oxidoreductase [Peristeroidobacter soli]|uniref:SDR family NAD(P)-dependent oxidoreductase n=1 Tax=Peristeroidobacter soli TaxID=2497877 RepID=UPI00101C69F7|nr:glucose 1-dehydrogenase [Peristeroidobacter soli]
MFAGKVALVTGGSSGLGEATALKFAQEGARVVVAARRAEQSARVVQRIVALGSEALFVPTDVSRAADVERMVSAAVEKFGRLDYAVNNAGIAGPRYTPIADVTEAQWDEVMGSNLKGVWLCMKYEIPALLASGGGAIVNIASIYGLKPSDIGHGPYAASKHGVVGLTRSAASDYGQLSIRINAVAPGFTLSEMVDPNRPGAAEKYQALTERHSGMKRLGYAEETANAITWLCSDAASYVNGVVLPVDGGSATRMY